MKKIYFVLVLLFISFLFFNSGFACIQKKQYSFYAKDGFYVFEFDLSGKLKMEPYVAKSLETVENIGQKTNSVFAINTGFFDANNKKTVSYVYKNNVLLADPNKNENLLRNAILYNNFDKILNRSEFRIYDCNGEFIPDIVPHNTSALSNCTIIHSTQAGPMLLPENTMEVEFFVSKKDGKVSRDSISLYCKKARSLVGIKNNKVYFFVTDENHPLTVFELIEKINKFNLEKAMGFDGGGSVSMYVNDKEKHFYYTAEKGGISRPIKSAIVIK